jgi:hypothetical protein
MTCVGSEPTILASERAETVHALDRSATVTVKFNDISYEKIRLRAYNLHITFVSWRFTCIELGMKFWNLYRSQVFGPCIEENFIFCDVTPCSPIEVHRTTQRYITDDNTLHGYICETSYPAV